MVDPVTAFLVSAGLNAAVASVVASAAVYIGITYVQRTLFGTRAPTQERQDVTNEYQATIQPMRRAYGPVLLGGVRAFWAVDADALYYKLLVLCTGKIDSIQSYWLDGERVTVDGSGGVTSGRWLDDGEQYAFFNNRLGLATETAYSEMVSAFTEWTSAHRLDGHATVLAKFRRCDSEKVPDIYPSTDAPAVMAEVHGVPVYDPRDASTAYSENPILQLLDYLRHEDGGDEDLANFDLDFWEDAADDCQAQVALAAGGTEDRYRAGVVVFYDQPLKENAEKFLRTCNGRLWETPEGKIAVATGALPTITVTVDEDDDHLTSIGFEPGLDELDAYSAINSTYVDPLADYTVQTSATLYDSTLQTKIGGTVVETIDRAGALSHTQNERLNKQTIADENPAFKVVVGLRFFGLRLLGERACYLNAPSVGIVNQPCWIKAHRINGHVSEQEVVLWAMDTSSRTWTTAEEQDPPSYEEAVGEESPAPPAPTGLTVTDNTGSFSVSWTAPADTYGARPILRWMDETVGAWVYQDDLAASATSSTVNGTITGRLYNVEVYYTYSGYTTQPETYGAGPVAGDYDITAL